MSGAEFVAVRRLSPKADPAVTLADVGETCERVPVTSLAALLASGMIRRRDARPADRERDPADGRRDDDG